MSHNGELLASFFIILEDTNTSLHETSSKDSGSQNLQAQTWIGQTTYLELLLPQKVFLIWLLRTLEWII
ncbi:MAG: hypothetical protein AM326_01980 [Candidatus Thorarchaeota archaeon SMTZ-45]|nr:MAG: hypothetical protein AM326_01980 [Candidatus Thorarchaeota archaeon SMTZ-45]